MVLVDIDIELYKKIKKYKKKNPVDYPSIKFFLNQAVLEKIRTLEQEQIQDDNDIIVV